MCRYLCFYLLYVTHFTLAFQQYAGDLATGNNTSLSTSISASPSPLVLPNATNTNPVPTVHGRVFQRLKQPVAKVQKPCQNTGKNISIIAFGF